MVLRNTRASRLYGQFLQALAGLLALLSVPFAVAQPPGGEGFRGGPGGGFRGGAPGGEGGFRGGPPGGFQGGGFPGGGFPGGGDRSSRGGPPGGFPGGGFPGGGDRSSRGGPPGGFPGGGFPGGGFPGGGDRSSRGGPPGGGFDPSQMLSRLDANGNGSIDPDEMQGPARFILDRLGRDNPEIATAMSNNKSIPLSKITKAIETARGGSSSSSSSNSGPNNSSQPSEPEPLVPGFGIEVEYKGILGFGPEGATAIGSIKVEERDLKEAKERIERYDRNKDGILDEREMAEGRWSDDPWQYDRNRDRKLSIQEMAMRYAKRRQTEESQRSQSSDSRREMASRRGGDDRNREQQREQEVYNPWANQASYRYTPSNGPGARVQGLPEWFSSGDTNGDGQVMMNEYASSWDSGLVEEFNRFDTNGDGAITTLEALAAVKKGILRGAGGASSSPVASTSSVSSRSTSSGLTTSSSASTAAAVEYDQSDLPEGAEASWVKYAIKRIGSFDADKNGRVTVDEWSASDGDFKSIDLNGDGVISVGEYYKLKKKK